MIKKLQQLQVEFEGARGTQVYLPTDEADVAFRVDDDTKTLVIYEEDADEKRALTVYAPGQWSAVRLFWKGED